MQGGTARRRRGPRRTTDLVVVEDISRASSFCPDARSVPSWVLVSSLFAPVCFIIGDCQGRMKFTRPLYRELFAFEETRSVAVQTFTERASFYHPICRAMVAKDLGVELGK